MSPSIRGSKSDTAAVTTASAVIGELHVPKLPVCLSAMIDNLPGRPRSPRVEESPAPRRNPAYPCRVGKRNKRTTSILIAAGAIMPARFSSTYSLWPEQAQPRHRGSVALVSGGFVAGAVVAIAANWVLLDTSRPTVGSEVVSAAPGPAIAAATLPPDEGFSR